MASLPVLVLPILALYALLALQTPCEAVTEPAPGADADPPPHHFVLVHGAFQSAFAWHRLIPLLASQGHTAEAVQMPGHGTDTTPPETLTSLSHFAAPVVEAVERATRPVVLVGHSMGGAIISTVAEAVPHKVSKLVYLAAALLHANQSIFGALTSGDYGTLLVDNIYPLPSPPGAPVFMDVREGVWSRAVVPQCSMEVQVLMELLFRPQIQAPMVLPITVTAARWGSVPRYYIFSDLDHALHPKLQQQMVDSVGADGTFFIKGSDHQPHLSRPEALSSILLSLTSAPGHDD